MQREFFSIAFMFTIWLSFHYGFGLFCLKYSICSAYCLFLNPLESVSIFGLFPFLAAMLRILLPLSPPSSISIPPLPYTHAHIHIRTNIHTLTHTHACMHIHTQDNMQWTCYMIEINIQRFKYRLKGENLQRERRRERVRNRERKKEKRREKRKGGD